MRNSKLLKGFVVIIIFLFIGLAVAPSINGNAVDSEMVELDIEISGLGKKHTVKLTQQEAYEVELLFKDVEQRLSEVETREEANELFRVAIVELDKYGLLGDLSVQQAQQLILGNEYIQRLIDNNDNQYYNSNFTGNYYCLVAGHLSNVFYFSPLHFLADYYDINYWSVKFPARILGFLMYIFFWGIAPPLLTVSPIHFSTIVSAGTLSYELGGGRNYRPAKGKIITFGLNGLKYWSGNNLYGSASDVNLQGSAAMYVSVFYPAFLFYKGIKLFTIDESYFLGCASKVNLREG